MSDNSNLGRLTGDLLRNAVRASLDNIRGAAGIRPKHSIPSDPQGQKNIRIVGKILPTAMGHARSLLIDAAGTGVFDGVGFNVVDLDAAVANLADKESTDTQISTVATDAHAEKISAKGDVATMVVQIETTRKYFVNNPGANPLLKAKVKIAGAALEADFADQNAVKSAASKQTKGMHTSLYVAKSENQKLSQDLSVSNVRSGLKIQYLQGEALRPEDVDTALAANNIPVSAPASTGKTKAGPAQASLPKGQGRRKSSRAPR